MRSGRESLLGETWGRRRLLGATAVGSAGAFLLACGGGGKSGGTSSSAVNQAAAAPTANLSASTETPRPGGTYISYIGANAPLDAQRVSASAQQVIGGVQSRLFRFKSGLDPKVITDLEIEPDVALSVEAADASTWTVKLRPDAKWHNVAPVNGRVVDAEDIKASFIRALDNKNPNAGSLNMMDAAAITTPDKTTVVFKLKYPYAPFRKTLASATYSWLFPREASTDGYDPSKVVIGSGPFMLDSIQPDVAYNFKRNPEWFDKGQPYLQGIKMAVVPDSAQQLAQFTAGNLDELILVTPDDVAAARQENPKATMIKAENAGSSPLYLQLGPDSGSPFLDQRVRRAFSMAIDRETLGKVIYGGEYKQMVFIPSYMGKWAIETKDLPAESQQYYKYNPAEAKKLLEAAGQSNIAIRYVMLVGSITPGSFGSPIWTRLNETVANMLSQVGIKTTIVTQDYNRDYIGGGRGSRQGNFDKDMIIHSGVAPNTDVDEFLFNHFDSRSTSNAFKLKDPQFDAMLEKQRTLVNEEERFRSLIEIQKYLGEKMYNIPTVGTYRWMLLQPRVRNFQYSHTLGKTTETNAKTWLAQ